MKPPVSRIDTYFVHEFAVPNDLVQTDGLSPLFLTTLVYNTQLVSCKATRRYRNWMAHISFCYIPTMLIYWAKPQAPRKRLYPLLMDRIDDGLDVDAEKIQYSQASTGRHCSLWPYTAGGSKWKHCITGNFWSQTFIGVKRGWRYSGVWVHVHASSPESTI
jgi:hypothetical protein